MCPNLISCFPGQHLFFLSYIYEYFTSFFFLCSSRTAKLEPKIIWPCSQLGSLLFSSLKLKMEKNRLGWLQILPTMPYHGINFKLQIYFFLEMAPMFMQLIIDSCNQLISRRSPVRMSLESIFKTVLSKFSMIRSTRYLLIHWFKVRRHMTNNVTRQKPR